MPINLSSLYNQQNTDVRMILFTLLYVVKKFTNYYYDGISLESIKNSQRFYSKTYIVRKYVAGFEYTYHFKTLLIILLLYTKMKTKANYDFSKEIWLKTIQINRKNNPQN